MRLLEKRFKEQNILHKYKISKYLQAKLSCINETGKYYESRDIRSKF